MTFKEWCRGRQGVRGEFTNEGVRLVAEVVASDAAVPNEWTPEQVYAHYRDKGARAFFLQAVHSARGEFLSARKVERRRSKGKNARVARRKNRK